MGFSMPPTLRLMHSPHLYDPALLPALFRYPAGLLALVRSPARLWLAPWTLIDARSEVGRLAWLLRCDAGRNLVPFASVIDARRDIACFDGNDASGDPAVEMLCTPAERPTHAFESFDAWHAAALRDAARWPRP